jgi:putative transcriptional regulator
MMKALSQESKGFPQNIVVSPAKIRERLNVSQHAFAGLLGVSVRTIQDWEQGRRQPSGPALALLRIVDREPEILLRVWS